MKQEPVLINGSWDESRSPLDYYSSVNPATGEPLGLYYPVSGYAEAENALTAAKRAAAELVRLPSGRIADFLELYAAKIESAKEDIIRIAALETALPVEPRLRSVEMPRTLNQLRLAASAVRDRSWCHAVIDTQAGLRSRYGPLAGPVLVFAPNNFPLAFNAAAGTDFVSALAAGNPVVSFSNPGHPGTTKIFAERALEAIRESALPSATLQLLYQIRFEDGFKLVAHADTAAVTFTGSKSSGLKLKKAADDAGKPVFLEMSSINPVLILPGALESRCQEMAQELFASCALGSGQFCTKPGLVVLMQSAEAEAFLKEASKHFESAAPGYLLGEGVLKKIGAVLENLVRSGARVVVGGKKISGPGFRHENTLLRLPGDVFLAKPQAFQEEVFGSVSLLVFAENLDQTAAILENMEGSLTGSVYSAEDGRDEAIYDRIEPILRRKVGRLLNDKMPTGVAVSPAMAHGGPYPATGHPAFTSVGIPASFLRFTALQSYDHVRERRLPPELRDKNPTGRMWRLIDGEWTRQDIV